eukprot:36666-Hanusia_phi.AAC.1
MEWGDRYQKTGYCETFGELWGMVGSSQQWGGGGCVRTKFFLAKATPSRRAEGTTRDPLFVLRFDNT